MDISFSTSTGTQWVHIFRTHKVPNCELELCLLLAFNHYLYDSCNPSTFTILSKFNNRINQVDMKNLREKVKHN